MIASQLGLRLPQFLNKNAYINSPSVILFCGFGQKLAQSGHTEFTLNLTSLFTNKLTERKTEKKLSTNLLLPDCQSHEFGQVR